MNGYLCCSRCGEAIPLAAWPMHRCAPRHLSPGSRAALAVEPGVHVRPPATASTPVTSAHEAGAGMATPKAAS